eukprot:Sspe_Gene.42681::Locus_20752_Transcript_1_1_Confidence_1.000_Length_1379::g.42681::m.42681
MVFTLKSRAKVMYEEGCYLLDGALSKSGGTVAVSNSLHRVKCYTTDTLQFTGEMKDVHNDAIRDIRFDKENEHLLWTADAEGQVVQWDTRTASGTVLPIYPNDPSRLFSFDVSAAGFHITLGDGGDVVLYDARNPGEAVLRFDDFHSDDITQVRYHPVMPNILCTGGEDALVLALDTNVPEENDITQWVFSTRDPVSRLTFHATSMSIVATTTCEGVLVGDLTSGDVVVQYDRPDESLYSVGVVGDMMVWGTRGDEGYLDLLLAPISTPPTALTDLPTLSGGHEDLVRFALPFRNSTIITGGEDGFLCQWSCSDAAVMEGDSAGPIRQRRELVFVAPPSDIPDLDTEGLRGDIPNDGEQKGKKVKSKLKAKIKGL